MKKLNANTMKHANTNLILETIIKHEMISRADLSRDTKLNKATVSAITKTLEDLHLISETGDSKDTGGRKAKLLHFNQNIGTIFAIDFGMDVIVTAITDLKGTVLYKKDYTTPSTDLDHQIDFIFEIIRDLYKNNPATTYGVVGLGIAIHGLIDTEQMIEYVPYYEWFKVNLKKIIETEFELPTTIENDSNLFTFGEYIQSHQDQNILGINISTGVGLGIIMNNTLYRGANGFAGELGHMIVQPNGKPCPCGNHGCLEQYASEKAMIETLSHKKNKSITHDEFISLVLLKDPDALDIMKDFVHYMSIAINNIGTLFNPSTIVLYSYTLHKMPKTIEAIKKNLNSKVFNVNLITVSEYKRNSILLGASFLAAKEFLGIKYFHFPTQTPEVD